MHVSAEVGDGEKRDRRRPRSTLGIGRASLVEEGKQGEANGCRIWKPESG